MTDHAIETYREKLYNELRWVFPSELPGILPTEDRYDRTALFFPVELGSGIEIFHQMGMKEAEAPQESEEKSIYALLSGLKKVLETDASDAFQPALSEQALGNFYQGDFELGLFPGEERMAFLFAPAGGGKSFLVRMLMLACLDETAESCCDLYGLPAFPQEWLVPLRLVCRDIEGSIVAAIEQEFRRVSGMDLPEEFDNSNFLIFADGLDEVEDSRREALLQDLVDYHACGARVVVTQRPTWMPPEKLLREIPDGFRSLCIRPMNERQVLGTEGIRGFAEQWYSVIYPKADINQFRARIRQILSRNFEFLRGLLDTPLMTMNILSVIAGERGVPYDRGALLTNLFEMLLRWKVPYEKCDKVPHDRMLVLSYLAWHISTEDMDLTMDLERLVALWQETDGQFTCYDPDAPRTWEEIRGAIQELTSSLSLLNWVRKEDGYGLAFSHRQYLEFLTAYAIVWGYLPAQERGKDVVELLRPHFEDSRWEDVILYTLYLLRQRQDYLTEERLIRALDGAWMKEESGCFTLLTLLRCRYPLSREVKKMLLGTLVPFTYYTAMDLTFLSRESEEFCERLIAQLFAMGEEFTKPAVFLQIRLDERRAKNPLSAAMDSLEEDRRGGARRIAMCAWIFTEIPEFFRRKEFPRLCYAPKDFLSREIVLAIRQEMFDGGVDADACGRLRLANFIAPEDLKTVFDQTMLDFCFDHVKRAWKSEKGLYSGMDAFLAFPITPDTLSLRKPEDRDFLWALGNAATVDKIWEYGFGVKIAAILSGTNPPLLGREFAGSVHDQQDGSLSYNRQLSDLLESDRELRDELRFAEKAVSLYLNGQGVRAGIALCHSMQILGKREQPLERYLNLAFLARQFPRVMEMCRECGYTVENLLERGVKEKHPLAMVNSVLWAMEQQGELTEDDVDALAFLSEKDWKQVVDWWTAAAQQGQKEEGLLVCWMARCCGYQKDLPHFTLLLRRTVRKYYAGKNIIVPI